MNDDETALLVRPSPTAAGPRPTSARSTAAIALALFVMVGAWILGAPRSAGPDEPGHNVRGGALVRGQLEGEPVWGVYQRVFLLPAHIGAPAPNCFAFQPFTPATCAAGLQAPDGDQLLGTNAADYPIWGHLPAGLGTFAPSAISPWAARAADAIIPMLLVAGAAVVAARRGALGVGVTMLAVTPMSWFMFATVNPNGLTIAGGLAAWTGLSALASRRSAPGGLVVPHDRAAAWLTAVGWAALVLPRRDGLVWGVLILGLAIMTMSIGARPLVRRLGTGPVTLIGVSTLATLVWAARSNTNDSRALLILPIVPLAAVAGRRLWRQTRGRTPAFRWAFAVAVAVAGVAVVLAVMSTRYNGVDRVVLRLVIGETGNNLRQAIGVLGWLDTPLPTSVMFLCVLAIGALVGAAVLVDERQIGLGMAAILVFALVVSWTLTMLQEDDAGKYWQGRYYLPLLVGIPVLGARVRLDPAASRRFGLVILTAALLVANLGLVAMMRRFAGGIAGTMLPWEWDTYGAPLPPVVLLAMHLGASFVILRWAATLDRQASDTKAS